MFLFEVCQYAGIYEHIPTHRFYFVLGTIMDWTHGFMTH